MGIRNLQTLFNLLSKMNSMAKAQRPSHPSISTQTIVPSIKSLCEI
jgi:hypothetical protein